MATAVRRRWSWRRWAERLESSPLAEEHKAICRRFMALSRDGGKVRRWVQGWEIDFKQAGLVGAAMHAAEIEGLCWRERGTAAYLACLGPARPRPGSIRLTPPQRAVLDAMLGGLRLYRINKAGYINAPGDKASWALRSDSDWYAAGLKPRSFYGRQAEPVRALIRHRLIVPDGCGYGWPFQWASSYRPVREYLPAVRGLSIPERYRAEQAD